MFSLIETIGMQLLRLRSKGVDHQVSVKVTDRDDECRERVVTIRAMSQQDCDKIANRYGRRWQDHILANKLERTLGLMGKNHVRGKDKKSLLGFFKVYSYQQALGYAFRPLGITHGKFLRGALANFSSNQVVDNQSPSPETLRQRIKYTLYHIAFNLGFLAMSMASAYIGYQHKADKYLLVNPHYVFALFCSLIGLISLVKNIRDRRRLKRMNFGAGG